MRIKTINIEQYMYITKLTEMFKNGDQSVYTKELIKYFDGSLGVSKEDGDETINTLTEVLNTKIGLVNRFKIDGTEFGLMPNFDKVNVGEYIDLEKYINDGIHLHKIMAILYRPIKKSKGKLYQIEKYEGTGKYSEMMKKVDFKIIKSAMVFFYNLRSSLSSLFLIYIQKKKLSEKVEKVYSVVQKRSNLEMNMGGTQ